MRISMHNHNQTQRGIVSFMVTLIMMLVISLIVIGFSQTARRTAREALDTQLSSQAFYAAESGVNMVAAKIKAGGTPTEKNDCNNTGTYAITEKLDGDNVKVTCVLVDPIPSDIKVGASQTESTIIPIDTGATPLSSLTFKWTPPQDVSAEVSGCSTTAGTFPAARDANCAFALLRVDLLKTTGAVNGFTALADNTLTFYLQPIHSAMGGGSASVSDFNSTNRGRIVGVGGCTTECSATIGFPAILGAKYYVRLSTLYADTETVTITGNGGAIQFSGIQAVIDSTGKAQDVLRRVQVRYPIGITHGEPPYAVQSSSTICKKFTVGGGQFALDPACKQ